MKISVLIHNLNRASALERCLSSVAKQTYRPLEMVILDAGSKDNSPTIIQQALEEMRGAGIETRVVACLQMGVAASRNFAARQASGDLLCFIDNDAAFTSSDGLCHLVKLFAGNPRLGLTSFQVLKADTDEIDPVGWVYRHPLATWSGREFKTFILNGTGFCARAGAFWEAGGFWEHLRYSREEEDLGLALVDKGLGSALLASYSHSPLLRTKRPHVSLRAQVHGTTQRSPGIVASVTYSSCPDCDCRSDFYDVVKGSAREDFGPILAQGYPAGRSGVATGSSSALTGHLQISLAIRRPPSFCRLRSNRRARREAHRHKS
jgi:hypothetical protein